MNDLQALVGELRSLADDDETVTDTDVSEALALWLHWYVIYGNDDERGTPIYLSGLEEETNDRLAKLVADYTPKLRAWLVETGASTPEARFDAIYGSATSQLMPDLGEFLGAPDEPLDPEPLHDLYFLDMDEE